MVKLTNKEHEKGEVDKIKIQTEFINEHNRIMKKLDEQFIHGVTYEYVTARDEKVCQMCLPLDGNMTKSSDVDFAIPPLHANCRCRLIVMI